MKSDADVAPKENTSLPGFIQRALAFFGLAEKHFKASEQLAQLQADLQKAQTDLTAAQAELVTAKEQLTKAQSDLAAANAEIASLKTKLAEAEKSAGAKANIIVAAQGIPADQMPQADPNAGGSAIQGETAWQKYNRLLATNPREAGEFYRANADEIFKTSKK